MAKLGARSEVLGYLLGRHANLEGGERRGKLLQEGGVDKVVETELDDVVKGFGGEDGERPNVVRKLGSFEVESTERREWRAWRGGSGLFGLEDATLRRQVEEGEARGKE